MEISLVVLFGIVFLAYFTQAMTGFGSIIIAVTLGAHLYPISFLLPVVIPLDILLNSYIVMKHRRHINKKVLFSRVFPSMLAGLVIGVLLFNRAQGIGLKTLFGIIVISISIVQLYELWRKKTFVPLITPFIFNSLIFFGGIIQGLFGSGGPFVVYAASRLPLPKSKFRSTLAGLWLTVNSILLISYLFTDKLTRETLEMSCFLLPTVIFGLFAGERAHQKADEHIFKGVIYTILFCSGLSMAISGAV